jgi:hypothetical protein
MTAVPATRDAGPAPAVRVARWDYHVYSSRDEDPTTIELRDSSGAIVGRASFVAEDEPLPPAERREGVIALQFRQSQLAQVLDLLRHDGVIELRWAGPFDTCLSSTTELGPAPQGGPP